MPNNASARREKDKKSKDKKKVGEGRVTATVDSRELYSTIERRVVKVDIYIQRQLTT
jgi:hypothetical protein